MTRELMSQSRNGSINCQFHQLTPSIFHRYNLYINISNKTIQSIYVNYYSLKLDEVFFGILFFFIIQWLFQTKIVVYKLYIKLIASPTIERVARLRYKYQI